MNGGKKKILPIPLMHRTVYNIPGGTEIKITLKNGGSMKGIVQMNPQTTKTPNMIELIKVTDLERNKPIPDSICFAGNEIKNVEILTPVDKKIVARAQTRLATVVFNDSITLDNLLINIKDVKEIGVKFHGIKNGRFSKVSWAMFCTNTIIMAFDIISLEDQGVPIWFLLQKHILENEEILKIFHNARPEVDYLYHKQTIVVKNVYDTQLVDFWIDKKLEMQGKLPRRNSLILLFTALSKYLEHFALESDATYLTYYVNEEAFQRETNNPLMVRPRPDKETAKYLSQSVKFLVPLREAMEKVRQRQFNQYYDEYMRAMVDTDICEAQEYLAYEDRLPKYLHSLTEEIFAPVKDSSDTTNTNAGAQSTARQ